MMIDVSDCLRWLSFILAFVYCIGGYRNAIGEFWESLKLSSVSLTENSIFGCEGVPKPCNIEFCSILGGSVVLGESFLL